MTGVILCGGKSTRMGSDKGLMQYQSITWAELAINKLAELNVPVVLSVNEQQYQLYSGRFLKSIIVKDVGFLEVYGPLKGILSVHLQYPFEDLLVLACDMPSMHIQVLEYLLCSNSNKEDAFVFKNDEQVEPLCAVYTAKGLSKIYQCYKHGQLKKHSLQYMVENLQTCYLPIPHDWKNYFTNYNSREDLTTL